MQFFACRGGPQRTLLLCAKVFFRDRYYTHDIAKEKVIWTRGEEEEQSQPEK